MVGKRTPWTGGNNYAKDYDAIKDSSTIRTKPKVSRFQDLATKEEEDEQRELIKNTLIGGVERDHLERFRKSAVEVSARQSSNNQN
jgi:hypothetical protein